MNDLVEREWSDDFGHHWEVASGQVISAKLTKNPLTGWPDKRDEMRAAVRQAALRAVEAG